MIFFFLAYSGKPFSIFFSLFGSDFSLFGPVISLFGHGLAYSGRALAYSGADQLIRAEISLFGPGLNTLQSYMAAEACDKSHSFFFACSIGPLFMFCMLSLLFRPGLNTLKRHMAAEARDKSLFFSRCSIASCQYFAFYSSLWTGRYHST